MPSFWPKRIYPSFFLYFFFRWSFWFFFFCRKTKHSEKKTKRTAQMQIRMGLVSLMVKSLPRTKIFIDVRNPGVLLQQVKMSIDILRNPVYFWEIVNTIWTWPSRQRFFSSHVFIMKQSTQVKSVLKAQNKISRLHSRDALYTFVES